jgi:hypothetical protein
MHCILSIVFFPFCICIVVHALYSLHCLLCIYCNIYILLQDMYSVPCTLCIEIKDLYSMHFTMHCIQWIVFYALYYINCVLCIVFYALNSIHCILCIVFYTLYYMHCILCNLFYAWNSMKLFWNSSRTDQPTDRMTNKIARKASQMERMHSPWLGNSAKQCSFNEKIIFLIGSGCLHIGQICVFYHVLSCCTCRRNAL